MGDTLSDGRTRESHQRRLYLCRARARWKTDPGETGLGLRLRRCAVDLVRDCVRRGNGHRRSYWLGPGSRRTFNTACNLRVARLGRFHLQLHLAIGRFLGTSHGASALLCLLCDIMSIGHFPAPIRAHISAAVETKQNGEDQKERQGFLVHTIDRAQGVRGPSRTRLCASAAAALYERRKNLAARGRRSQTAATISRERNSPRGDKRCADRPATALASLDPPNHCFVPASSAAARFRFGHSAKFREGPRIALVRFETEHRWNLS